MSGRPSKRTPDREARLLEALRAGSTRKNACAYAGVTEQSFQRWMLSNVAFVAAIEKAEADVQLRHEAQIAQAANTGTWQAAAWWLERRRPDDYARRDRLEVTLRQQAERLATDLGLDPEELLAEAERLLTNRA